jgi:hypothetical protein
MAGPGKLSNPDADIRTPWARIATICKCKNRVVEVVHGAGLM